VHPFITRHLESVIGILSGFDRVVFRGTLRRIAYTDGLAKWLNSAGILLKEFKDYALAATARLKEASLGHARETDRPIIYLPSPKTSKEEAARKIAERDGIKDGLVAVFTCVEPCLTYEIHRSREKKRLELQARRGQCLFLYHYMIHPVVGFMNARIQTWFPFNIQICINGRIWLARQLDHAGIDYWQEDNCFPWIADLKNAQKLFDSQLKQRWPSFLDSIARLIHPVHDNRLGSYYWSAYQAEWATDVMFRNPDDLHAVYPALVRHAICTFDSSDVMRFLGKRLTGNFQGEVVSDVRERPEGMRVKHRVDQNSVKIYDKAGSILRTETTINDPSKLSVYRSPEGKPNEPLRWLPLRKGIADLARRAELSQEVNERYLDALSAADTSARVGDLLGDISRRRQFHGRPARALRPTDPQDLALFKLLASGELAIHGLRNQDVQRALYSSETNDPFEKKRRTARATRFIHLLRAHQLIRKKAHTHRYAITSRGLQIAAAAVATQNATVKQLTTAA
jgi:hypothetical protein